MKVDIQDGNEQNIMQTFLFLQLFALVLYDLVTVKKSDRKVQILSLQIDVRNRNEQNVTSLIRFFYKKKEERKKQALRLLVSDVFHPPLSSGLFVPQPQRWTFVYAKIKGTFLL